jgi:hypothetical protein
MLTSFVNVVAGLMEGISLTRCEIGVIYNTVGLPVKMFMNMVV